MEKFFYVSQFPQKRSKLMSRDQELQEINKMHACESISENGEIKKKKKKKLAKHNLFGKYDN